MTEPDVPPGASELPPTWKFDYATHVGPGLGAVYDDWAAFAEFAASVTAEVGRAPSMAQIAHPHLA